MPIVDELQSYLSLPAVGAIYRVQRPIECADGFTISVQASSMHMCHPRDDTGPYTHVEIGYPSSIEPLLFSYVDFLTTEENPSWTEAVYPHVPIELAAAILELHGGAELNIQL